MRVTLASLLLLGASAVLLFWKLGTTSVHNGDEAVYLQSAREMLETGDWMTVRYHGELSPEKPPGKMWLIALGYRVLGVNEWGGRLSSALFALGTIALTVVLGRAMFGGGVGLLAGAILATSTQFLHEHCARTAEQEPETAFLYVAAMLCTWNLRRDPRWLVGTAASLAGLVMIKGPIVGPAAVVAVAHPLVTGTWRRVRFGRAALAAAVFLVLVVPWHAQQLEVHGEAFGRSYFGNQWLGRVGPPAAEDELAPDGFAAVRTIRTTNRATFYPRVLFPSLFPWSLLILPGAGLLLARLIRRRADSGEGLLLLWLAAYGATIAVIWTQFPWYVVPVLPALALLVALLCHRAVEIRPRIVVPTAAVALLAGSAFVPCPEYDPYSRRSPLWPETEPSLEAAWSAAPEPIQLPPLWVSGVLAAVALALGAGRRLDGARAARAAVVGSFLFASAYHSAIPLRFAGRRSEIARCADAARAAGLSPERVFLLGGRAVQDGTSPLGRFYTYGLTQGRDDAIVVAPQAAPALVTRSRFRKATLVLAEHRLTRRMPGVGDALVVHEGELDAVWFGRE